MIRILSVCASPVPDSSTEILLRRVAGSIRAQLDTRSRHDFIRLSEYDITPCQACGEAPTPNYCFLDDAMSGLYAQLEQCDCLLFGSPIYFDSVSASAKLFIDRCNCVRPYNFGRGDDERHFVRRWERSRPGAIVLVGSEKAWFEGARRCIAGFFKWVEVTNEGLLTHQSADAERTGDVVDGAETAPRGGSSSAAVSRRIIRKNHARR